MSEKGANEIFERFQSAGENEYEALRQEYKSGGYSMFSELLEGLRQALLIAAEEQMDHLRSLVSKGRLIIPDPGAISPSWERIWTDYEGYITRKSEALAIVEPANRDGEWQIVMDNPYTNESIACYPGLSFVEAAYLYAYFRKDLKKNEYLRLQKIANLIITSGE
jgi:hypothetical protein